MHIDFKMAVCTASSSIRIDKRIGTLSAENFVRWAKDTWAGMTMLPPIYKLLHPTASCRILRTLSLRKRKNVEPLDRYFSSVL